jgi:hypothetical protein
MAWSFASIDNCERKQAVEDLLKVMRIQKQHKTVSQP